jgi:hypothetical protein
MSIFNNNDYNQNGNYITQTYANQNYLSSQGTAISNASTVFTKDVTIQTNLIANNTAISGLEL